MKVCWGVEIQRHPTFILTHTEHISSRGYTFRARFMSVGFYTDMCLHVSQYFVCSLQFECCAVRLDLCVRRKKLKVVRFGVYVAVFRCRFSRPWPLSMADGGTAFLINVGTSRPRMPEYSPQQNQTGPVCSEVCHFGVLLLHTCNPSSCVQPCTVFCTSLKLCVPSNRICESRGVFSESRPACLHTELRTCWVTDMENGGSSPSQQQPVASATHLTLWYRRNIYTSFLPWNLCAYIYIYIYIYSIGLATLQSPVVTIFTIRFDVKQCYPLSWAVHVRSANLVLLWAVRTEHCKQDGLPTLKRRNTPCSGFY